MASFLTRLGENADSTEFWAACNREELVLRYCTSCKTAFYYPRGSCPRCGARSLSWIRSSGTGRVFTWTSVRASFYGNTWESELPYTVVLVDLADGPRMLSRLLSAADPYNGMDVEVYFESVEDQLLPYFRPTNRHSEAREALTQGEQESAR